MGKPPYRILFVNHVAELGGAETGLFDMATRLDRRFFTPLVVLPGLGPLAEALARRDVRVHILPLRRLRKSFNLFKLLSIYGEISGVARRLAKLIGEESVDLIHSNSTTAHIYGARAARLAGVPAIWHCRDMVALGPLGKWLGRNSARMVAISGAVQACVGRYAVGMDEAICIHNGIDVDLYRQPDSRLEFRDEFKLREEQLAVGMAAQMVPWKNHGLFLRAAALTAKEFPSAIFFLAGADLYGDHPGYRSRLEKLADELGLRDVVIFMGFRKDMPRVLAGMDMLVHPASHEPFGRALAEAMAAGKPVVAVNSDGPRELIEDGVSGLLVPPDDAETLAIAMRRILKDRALAVRLGDAARLRIENDFRVDRMVEKIELLYREVLSPP